MKLLVLIIIPFILLGQATLAGTKHKDNILDEVKDLMTGSFSSQEQSKKDKDFFDIRLEMVQIWPEEKAGYWLYVEQASAKNLENPYRQRVYHLTEKNGIVTSTIYALPKPLSFAGFWRSPEKFSKFKKDSLILRKGCDIFLKKTEEFYAGSTDSKKCTSKLRGASYATSEVKLNGVSITSWDRGYNEKDEQVWGAKTGSYIFSRKMPTPKKVTQK